MKIYHKQNMLKFLRFMLVLLACIGSVSCCDRTPDGSGANKSPPNGNFRIMINGNPEKYVPKETYTITLFAKAGHSFSGFMLAVEKPNLDIINKESSDAGVFSLIGDSLTTISLKCNNTVTQTSTLPKTEIQARWKAPPAGSGCVIFRATVVEHRDVWYMDDGPLSKRFCEDQQEPSDVQPAIVEPCCACHEAKYELTFEGLWSRHTHPKDFPVNGWLTKFSDIIGASHTVDYRFWEYGQLASEGLRQVAEHGSTRTLEGELKSQSQKIRTIIKARGISYPNVTGKTFAVFRVDSNHHLVSLVSQIEPSPDWIVGVSGLELCLSDCTWIENKVQNLYPWDAGTDSGPTYLSPDQPTNPRDVIRRIKTNYPNDPRSPFYDESEADMKPMARIRFTRQRLYEKNCENTSVDGDDDEHKAACETSRWSDWSECSVRCGKGRRHRQKHYKDSALANRMGCRKKLVQREDCYGSRCDNEDSEGLYPITPEGMPECALSEWSPWSSCSSKCGKGTRTKKRKYLNRRARKKCEAGAAVKPILELNEECVDNSDCGGDITETPLLDYHPDCPVSNWSDWSACSVSCGNGTRVRTRIKLHGGYSRRGYHRSGEDNYLEGDDPCETVRLQEEVTCYEPSCDTKFIPEFCYFEPEVGHCRSTPSNRWYYEAQISDCAVFSYTGCGGNKNNFMSREKCLETCRAEDDFSNISVENQLAINYPVDCKLSEWVRGPCNATCGDGFRVKTRRILRAAKNGGTPCPRKLVRFEKCYIACHNHQLPREPTHKQNNRPRHNSTIHNVHPSDEEYDEICEYSEWSPWSPCTASCGDRIVVRQRTRTLLNPELSHKCMNRLQVQACDVMPCPIND